MVKSSTKKIVVISGISSSQIEEAILILKNEPEDAPNGLAGKGKKDTCADSELLLKEAEEIKPVAILTCSAFDKFSSQTFCVVLFGNFAGW